MAVISLPLRCQIALRLFGRGLLVLQSRFVMQRLDEQMRFPSGR
jgi:hypothetical protein